MNKEKETFSDFLKRCIQRLHHGPEWCYLARLSESSHPDGEEDFILKGDLGDWAWFQWLAREQPVDAVFLLIAQECLGLDEIIKREAEMQKYNEEPKAR